MRNLTAGILSFIVIAVLVQPALQAEDHQDGGDAYETSPLASMRAFPLYGIGLYWPAAGTDPAVYGKSQLAPLASLVPCPHSRYSTTRDERPS